MNKIKVEWALKNGIGKMKKKLRKMVQKKKKNLENAIKKKKKKLEQLIKKIDSLAETMCSKQSPMKNNTQTIENGFNDSIPGISSSSSNNAFTNLTNATDTQLEPNTALDVKSPTSISTKHVFEIELFEIGGESNTKKNYYDKKGFIYGINNSNKTTKYYRCKNYKKHGCNARVIVRDGKLEHTILSQPHRHEPNQVDLDRVKFSKKLEEICRENPFLIAQDVYDNAKVALRNEINMLHIKAKRKYDSFIHSKQKLEVPLHATTVEQFEELINDPKFSPRYLYDERQKLFFRGVWRGTTGSNVVFISETILQAIRKSQNVVLLMDGTFKSLPRHLKFGQLYIISVVIKDRCYPLAYILMEKKDTCSYELIFNNLIDLTSFNVVHCMSDYEASTRKALKNVFPSARISGCYFHYVQATMKASKRFGLKKDPKFANIIQQVSALALLPNEFIIPGFNIISKQFQKSKRWDRFKKYWFRQWAPANISVFGLKHRTNNFAESLNKVINMILKSKRPHVWRLIQNLRMVEMNRSDEFQAVEAGDMIETRGNNEMKRLNKKIEEATTRFKETENVKNFLKNGIFNKKVEKDVMTFLKNVTFNEKLENFFIDRIEVGGGADTEGVDDYNNSEDCGNDDFDEDYDETVIPNNYNIESNFRQSFPRSAAKRKKKSLEIPKKKQRL